MKTVEPTVSFELSCHISTPGANATSSFQFFDQLRPMSQRQFFVSTGRRSSATSTPRLLTSPALMSFDAAPVAQSAGTVMIWSVVVES